MRRRVLGGVCAGLCVLAAVLVASPASGAGGERFEPWAASFLSPTSGFVLGVDGCPLFVNGPQRSCRAVVAATLDGGAQWRTSVAPAVLQPVLLSSMGGPAVKAIAFADPRDGWIYEPGLWATHDGGRHWSRIALQVSDLVVADGWAYATIATGSGRVLARSPASRNDWQPIDAVPKLDLGIGGEEPAAPLSLAASADTIWLGLQTGQGADSSTELWRSTDGTGWREISAPCPRGAALLNMAASSPTVLLIECDGELLLSTDGGAHAHLIPGARGSPRVIAAPLGQSATILLGTLNYPGTPVPRQWPTSALTRTINDGNSWTRTSYPQRGAGFTDPQFTNGTDGWVIHGYPGGPADELLHTTNAGATFVLVPF